MDRDDIEATSTTYKPSSHFSTSHISTRHDETHHSDRVDTAVQLSEPMLRPLSLRNKPLVQQTTLY